MYYQCGKNKVADQLRSYRITDLRLVFSIFSKVRFLIIMLNQVLFFILNSTFISRIIYFFYYLDLNIQLILAILIFMSILTFVLSRVKHEKGLLPLGTLSYIAVQLRPGAECVNILSYVVTFPSTTARKTFFGTPTGPTQTSLFRYVNSRSKLEQKNNNIIHFHLKMIFI